MKLTVTMKCMLTALALFCLSSISVGQSTDRLYFHYLFDISGSVYEHDVNDNLQYLLGETLETRDDKINRPVGFNLYFFGQNKDSAQTEVFNLFTTDDPSSLQTRLHKNIFKEIDEGKRNIQQYTHIAAAFNSYRAAQPQNTSGATLLFTDGLLKSGDINDGDSSGIKDYIEEIDSLIDNRRDKMPVFLVQSSYAPINEYFKIDTSYALKSIPGKAYLGPDYFWVNSSITAEDEESVVNLYKEYLQYINFQIINYKQVIDLDDRFMRMYLLSKISLIDDEDVIKAIGDSIESNCNAALYTSYYDIEPEYFSPDSVPNRLEKLISYGNGSELTFDEISDIKPFLNYILNDTAVYRYLQRKYSEAMLVNDPSFTIYDYSEKYQLSQPEQLNLSEIENEIAYENIEDKVIKGLSDYLIKRTEEEIYFLFYDQIHNKLVVPSTFIKDTLLYHVSSLVKTRTSNIDLSLQRLKEAVKQDISELPQNLLLHPKAIQHDGLQALYYTQKLIQEIKNKKNLEQAFASLLDDIKIDDKQGITELERGFLFVTELISIMNKHNLYKLYMEADIEEKKSISRVLAVAFAVDNPDIVSVNQLDEFNITVSTILNEYSRLRDQISFYKAELKRLATSNQNLKDLTRYKHELQLSIFRSASEMMFSGLNILKFFADEQEMEDLRLKMYEYNKIANIAIDIWAELDRQNYGKVATLLIQLIPDDIALELQAKETTLENLTAKLRKQLVVLDHAGLVSDTATLATIENSTLKKTIEESLILKSDQEIAKYFKGRGIHFLFPLFIEIRNKKLFENLDNYQIEQLNASENELQFLIHKCLKMEDQRFISNYLEKHGFSFLATNMSSIYRDFESDSLDFVDSLKLDSLKKMFRKLSGKNFADKYNEIRLGRIYSAVKDYNKNHQEIIFQYLQFAEINQQLKKFISVAGEISNSTTEQQIKTAIERFTLPVASYRVKRQERFTVMVNAYTGYGASFYVQEQEQNGNRNWEHFLSAPIGLELSKMIRKPTIFRNSSLSLFFPILDVGNVINYRLQELSPGDEGYNQEFRFSQVLSPGVHVSFGLFRKLPFSLNLGYQSNPGRLLATLNFDLPLIRLR